MSGFKGDYQRKYTGVYQRKDGTWYYRIKKVINEGEKPIHIQKSGFPSEDAAHRARLSALRIELFSSDGWHGEVANQRGLPFGEFFQKFINDCDSDTSAKKYKALYNAQLTMWTKRDTYTISDSDIDVLLLKLSLQGYKESYISSIRKMVKKFYQYAHRIDKRVSGDIAQVTIAKPYKLRVLSLFSGLGAPERALNELEIDYELVKFCEIDDKAARAYCLLHEVNPEKRIKDINLVNMEYSLEQLPNFDIMIFGFPCQSVSTSGKREGIIQNSGYHPSNIELFFNEAGELTRSGLFYKALQIALWKKPKFLVAENVANLVGKEFEPDFRAMVRNLQDAGYNVFFQKLNSKDFNVPQNRDRVFMVMIREDLNMDFKFPQSIPLEVRAEDWYETDVSEEYYLKSEDIKKLDRESFKPNFNRDIISCIMTKWGRPDPYTQQTFVKDNKGIRCLSSTELMKFQGFSHNDGTMLRENGFSKADIGKLVGNSITVPVFKAIIKQFAEGLSNQIAMEIIPEKIVEAKTDDLYIQPLFAYMGNKSKLLPYLGYLLPNRLSEMVFVDLFTGSGVIAANVKADRIILNDKDNFLIDIYKALSITHPQIAWDKVMSVVDTYGLSAENEEGYLQCRVDYNKIPYQNRGDYWYWGLALVYHSFNSSFVQHNKKGEFNSPFGHLKCNIPNSKNRFFPFAEKLYHGNYEFHCQSYNEILVERKRLDEDIFYYVDPPYLSSTATYNKDWTEQEDKELYAFLDECNKQGIKWMLSNVLENNGQRNEVLSEWLKENQWNYKIYYMKRDYGYSSYNRKNKGQSVEIVVVNYKV